MSFEAGDSTSLLANTSEGERPDIVFLDPMFPEESHSSALPKKGMQLFRRLIGDDADAAEVLKVALTTARERIVVKRPIQAPPLAQLKPSLVYEGKTARYDVYRTK
jgi:16S rRNA (guanine1516-N2)-methyltransferase